MTKAVVYAKHNNARIAPKKMAVVMDIVRGKSTEEAKKILAFDETKSARMLLKVLKSAEANAKNNLNIDPSRLVVSDLQVNGGPMFKRGRFAGRGYFNPILKRTSHIVVGLSERQD